MAAVPPNAGARVGRTGLPGGTPSQRAALPDGAPPGMWPSLATPFTGGMLLMADFVHGGKEEEDMWVSHVIL